MNTLYNLWDKYVVPSNDPTARLVQLVCFIAILLMVTNPIIHTLTFITIVALVVSYKNQRGVK